ncbi:Fe(3+) ABC transporter substrate-binding protein [Pseudidiomarina taiwanensis]|uniref:Fe(3+) ABC transporter substrate-binding protein n=1 Tax=Pseudidiomarina taiwanensis TaxID=337250 RepID=A0A432ZK18_9GAMM|nr:Fe(3+) ABC transporter substrate-binding protein [Pseudidiomarina taiwanensis]RUO78311.1 Fe(3+) ABC transporter substrate-binding protein [Pseudidiomarina taiwanensis]
MHTILRSTIIAISAVATLGLSAYQAQASEVNVYSARKENLIKPLLERFTEQTGIEVNLLTGNGDALLMRLQNEGRNTPADLFLTVDAGNLHRAATAGVFQPLSATVTEQVPSNLVGVDNSWVGLSLRARPIFYAADRVDPSTLTGYESLTDSHWHKNVCIRSSDNIYNQSLTAALIAHWGQEKTETWAQGLVANLAKPPVGGDRDQIKAVAAGVCDLAVANTYYLGIMEGSDDPAEREAASKVKIFWPNQDEQGTHINVSGIGLTKHAKNKAAAEQLIRFLLSSDAQQWYAATNNEYPAVSSVTWSERLQNWGTFKMDELPMVVLGENNAEAVKLMNRAGWR